MSRLPYSYVGAPLGKHAFGKVTVEVFVDFFCPFSAKCTPVLFQLAELENVALRVIPYPQPWHFEGGLIATAFNTILKCEKPEGAAKYYKALMDAYPKFKEEGKKMSAESILNLACSLKEGISDMKDKDFMQGVKDDKSPGVLRQLKNQIKYGRTNAIHETPTFKVNGLVVGASSSWDIAEWKEFLAPLLA